MATTYYHVAGAGYELGDDILPFTRLVERGDAVVWKWADAPEGYDGDVVCVFDSLDQAIDFRAEFGGTLILAITVPDDEPADGAGLYPTVYAGSGYLSPRLTTVVEGYTAFESGVPAAWLRVVV